MDGRDDNVNSESTESTESTTAEKPVEQPKEIVELWTLSDVQKAIAESNEAERKGEKIEPFFKKTMSEDEGQKLQAKIAGMELDELRQISELVYEYQSKKGSGVLRSFAAGEWLYTGLMRKVEYRPDLGEPGAYQLPNTQKPIPDIFNKVHFIIYQSHLNHLNHLKPEENKDTAFISTVNEIANAQISIDAKIFDSKLEAGEAKPRAFADGKHLKPFFRSDKSVVEGITNSIEKGSGGELKLPYNKTLEDRFIDMPGHLKRFRELNNASKPFQSYFTQDEKKIFGNAYFQQFNFGGNYSRADQEYGNLAKLVNKYQLNQLLVSSKGKFKQSRGVKEIIDIINLAEVSENINKKVLDVVDERIIQSHKKAGSRAPIVQEFYLQLQDKLKQSDCNLDVAIYDILKDMTKLSRDAEAKLTVAASLKGVLEMATPGDIRDFYSTDKLLRELKDPTSMLAKDLGSLKCEKIINYLNKPTVKNNEIMQAALHNNGFELKIFQSKEEFDKIKNFHQTCLIKVSNDQNKNQYELWENKTGKWESAVLRDFNLPTEWNNKTSVFVKIDNPAYNQLKPAHTPVHSVPAPKLSSTIKNSTAEVFKKILNVSNKVKNITWNQLTRAEDAEKNKTIKRAEAVNTTPNNQPGVPPVEKDAKETVRQTPSKPAR